MENIVNLYAYNSLLALENIRIEKDMRNNVNRIVNCETANLNKVVHAAVKQIACINYISETQGLHFLPDLLKEAAELRLAHQEAPVGELAAMCEKPVSKSGFNHRLKRLEKLAEGMGFKEIGNKE